MKLFLEQQNQNKEIRFTGTVGGLLKHIAVNPETVLVSRGDELLTESDQVSDTDSIKLLSVVSGG